MSMSAGNRDNTVRAASTDNKHAQPRTVLSMNEMRTFALEVGDENGQKQQVVAFRVNGVWYHDPVGKAWLDRLRPIKTGEWLAKELEERFTTAGTPVTVPKADVVDIMGAGKVDV